MKIQEMIADISKSINDNKLVVFVGAGVSKNYGYPDWNKLTDKILAEINLEKHIELKNILEDCKQPVISANKKTLKKTINKLGYATDEYLMYAQYLYNYLIKKYKNKNEREKKFIEIVKKILNDKEKVDEKYDIISKIFELTPQHIITTNFDSLLEDYNHGNYELIVQDTDIANSNSNNYIIKMHGDFEHTNIVLKESDYHNYSENFKLIDNFIKSVFASYTLLFIGFSANDPNFKQIYAWISRILGEETRNAYFLNLNKKSIDKHRISYLNNKFINIINFEDILAYHNDDFDIKDYGKRLEYCLDKINKSYIDKFLDSIYILKTSKYPIVWGFEEILNKYGMTISYNELKVKNAVVYDLFLKPTIYEKDKRAKLFYKFLFSELGERGQIIFDDKKIEITEFYNILIKNKSIPKEMKLLSDFNYNKLERLLQNYPKTLNLSNHRKLKRKAYLLTMMSKNDEAYDILSELLIFYKNRKMYFEYFNTGFDRNFTRSYYTGKMEYFDFDKEMKKISLNDRIKLSSIFVSIKQRLYYLEKIEDSMEITNEIIDLVEFYNRGGIQNSSLIERLIFAMDNTFKILYDEGICSNYSELFKYNLKSYFISYYTKYNIDKVDERFDHFFGEISTVTELEFYYLYYAIQFLNPKDWNNILNYSDQDLEINNKLTNEILKLLHNIYSYILQKETWTRKSTNYLVERLCNFIILFSNASVKITEFTRIIEIISPVIFKFDVHQYSEYLKKFCNKHKKYFVSENSEKLKPLFNNIIKSLENEKRLNPLSDFRSILSLFENVNFNKKLAINNKGINNIESLIENERAIFDKCIGINMLISIYHNCSRNLKINLASYVQNFFENNFKEARVTANSYLCLHKAIKKSIFHKAEELKFISEMLKQPLSEKDKHFIFYLDTVYQLKKENKLNQNNINKYLSKYSKSNPFYRIFLFEDRTKNHDIDFKARWLLHLIKNPTRIIKIIKFNKLDIRNLISKASEEMLFEENKNHKEDFQKLINLLLNHC